VLKSPEMRCGKTTVLIILQLLTPNSELASNISPAAIFRYIEQHRPTLLIDEADTFVKRNDEIRNILNSGHTRAKPTSSGMLRSAVNTEQDVSQHGHRRQSLASVVWRTPLPIAQSPSCCTVKRRMKKLNACGVVTIRGSLSCAARPRGGGKTHLLPSPRRTIAPMFRPSYTTAQPTTGGRYLPLPTTLAACGRREGGTPLERYREGRRNGHGLDPGASLGRH
jgi:hypothetical protein